jgi:RNA polymerase sigma factor for flagellar operon FliA
MKATHLKNDSPVELSMHFVKKIAQHLMGRLPACVQIDDLMQAGMIGLLEAQKNYDDIKGASFETYATIRVRGSMLDEIRKGDWVPRSVHRNTRRIAETVRRLENQMGRLARDIEIAHAMDVKLDEYHQMIQDTYNVRLFGFEDLGLHDDILSSNLANPLMEPLDGLHREDVRASLAKNMESLPERERLVLKLYYDEELNLRQIGEVLGVSESRASQIHAQAMARLQARFKAWSA